MMRVRRIVGLLVCSMCSVLAAAYRALRKNAVLLKNSAKCCTCQAAIGWPPQTAHHQMPNGKVCSAQARMLNQCAQQVCPASMLSKYHWVPCARRGHTLATGQPCVCAGHRQANVQKNYWSSFPSQLVSKKSSHCPFYLFFRVWPIVGQLFCQLWYLWYIREVAAKPNQNWFYRFTGR